MSKVILLAVLLAGCNDPVTKTELFRGQEKICARTTQGDKTINLSCVPAEQLAIHLGDCE